MLDSGVGSIDEDDKAIRARRRSRAKMGARENNDRMTSFMMIHGEATREERDCGVEDGFEATVWSMSPI